MGTSTSFRKQQHTMHTELMKTRMHACSPVRLRAGGLLAYLLACLLAYLLRTNEEGTVYNPLYFRRCLTNNTYDWCTDVWRWYAQALSSLQWLQLSTSHSAANIYWLIYTRATKDAIHSRPKAIRVTEDQTKPRASTAQARPTLLEPNKPTVPESIEWWLQLYNARWCFDNRK